MWTINYDNELYHHGIKGQKWGIRRFQNEDGSLTPEGERRYGHMSYLQDKSPSTQAKMKDWWDLDDDEFRRKYRVSKEKYSRNVRRYGDPDLYSRKATKEAFYKHKYANKIGSEESEAHQKARELRSRGVRTLLLGGTMFTVGAMNSIGGLVMQYNGVKKYQSHKLTRGGKIVTNLVGRGGMLASVPVTAVGAFKTVVGAERMKAESDRQERERYNK